MPLAFLAAWAHQVDHLVIEGDEVVQDLFTSSNLGCMENVVRIQCLRLMISLSEYRWIPLWCCAEVEGVPAPMPEILV